MASSYSTIHETMTSRNLFLLHNLIDSSVPKQSSKMFTDAEEI